MHRQPHASHPFVDVQVWQQLQVEKLGAGNHSYLITWRGSNPALKPSLFISHVDVVPVSPGTEQDWTHPPFGGAVADGFIWGKTTLTSWKGLHPFQLCMLSSYVIAICVACMQHAALLPSPNHPVSTAPCQCLYLLTHTGQLSACTAAHHCLPPCVPACSINDFAASLQHTHAHVPLQGVAP